MFLINTFFVSKNTLLFVSGKSTVYLSDINPGQMVSIFTVSVLFNVFYVLNCFGES